MSEPKRDAHSHDTCVWCGAIPEQDVFGLGARARPGVDLEPYRGQTLEIVIATLGKKVRAIVVTADSPAAKEGNDFYFMTCSEVCGQALKEALGEDVALGDELLEE